MTYSVQKLGLPAVLLSVFVNRNFAVMDCLLFVVTEIIHTESSL